MQVRTLKIGTKLKRYVIVIRPPPQKQYLEHRGAILSLSHSSIYQYFTLFPFSAHVGRKLTCGIVVANLPTSTLQNNTFIVCGKLPRGVILKIYPPLEPSKPYG